MNFTISYKRDISHCYMSPNARGYSATIIADPLFRGFLTVDTSKESFEVPSAIRENSLKMFPTEMATAPLKVFPLYVGQDLGTVTTGDAIMKKFMTTTYETRISKVRTSKGEVYYGGKGMIFDKDFKPLLLCTYEADFDESGGPISRKLMLRKKIVHIHPQVFIDPTVMIHKAIVNRFVPFVLSQQIRGSYTMGGIKDVSNSQIPIIVVDNMESIFSKGSMPKPSDTSVSEDINKFLIENEHLLSAE